MRSRAASTFLVIGALAFGSGIAAAQTPIATCGLGIVGDAILTTDLLCDGGGTVTGVTMSLGTLNLNGHTIDCGGSNRSGAACVDRCKIVGPGTITGCAALQGAVVGGERLDLADMEVVDNPTVGVAGARRFVIKNATISRNGIIGIYAGHRLVLQGSTVDDNAGIGIKWNNELAVLGKSRATIKDSSITGNDADGIYSAVRVTVRNAVITGNVVNPADEWCLDTGEGGKRGCADIQTPPLRLRGVSACDSSLQVDSLATLGICAND